MAKGTVSTVSYLQAHGFSHKLLNKYKNSGWLSSLGHGAHTLPMTRWNEAIRFIHSRRSSIMGTPAGKRLLK